MTNSRDLNYAARSTILKFLSDDENAKVSMAEGGAALAEGEEYVDLEHLDRGFQRAKATMAKPSTEHMIPRSALRDATWNKILAQLPR
jgi:hypothetical protein